MRAALLVPVSVLVLGLAAAPASAQPCGPLTFGFSGTGAGFAPFGGTPPVLSGAAMSVLAPPSCSLTFILTPAPALALSQVGVLVIGATNPMLNLGIYGYPTCTARASLDVVLILGTGPAPGTLSLTIPIPPRTTFLGVSTFQQCALIQLGLTGLSAFLSNGVRMDIT